MTRRRILTVTALAVIGIAAASAVDWPAKLIWNATASAPIGFYTIEPADALDVPELVAVMPPEPLAAFMVERGYRARRPVVEARLGPAGGSGFAAPATPSRLTGSRWARRWSATASAAICPSGRAAASSATTRFS
jgi:hypothetical protein